MNLKTLIFTGRSGCGKGTQVNQLIEYLRQNDERNIFHLESGNRFRQFIQGDKYASSLAKKISEVGGLQPEFLSTWVWASELIENMNPDTHLLIDGTPRRLVEAKTLESAFDFFERPRVDIVYINVSREWATEKLHSRGRADDVRSEDIKARLDWFETDVVPAIDYYRSHRSHVFHEINGEQSVEKVQQDIIKSVFND